MLALLGARERILDGSEYLRADRSTGLAHSRCKAKVVAAKWSGEGFRSAKEGRDTRAHLAESVENAVEDDKEREDGLDRSNRAAQDEAKESPEEEAERHGLLAADLVHEESADDAAGKVEAVHDGSVADVLDEGVVWVELTDDGG